MDLNDFTSRIMKPTEQPVEEPVVDETPEHPNTPILENMMVNQDERGSETNKLLEHLLVKLDDSSDRTIDEHTLVVLSEIKDALQGVNITNNLTADFKPIVDKIESLIELNKKSMDSVVKELNKPWTVKLELK